METGVRAAPRSSSVDLLDIDLFVVATHQTVIEPTARGAELVGDIEQDPSGRSRRPRAPSLNDIDPHRASNSDQSRVCESWWMYPTRHVCPKRSSATNLSSPVCRSASLRSEAVRCGRRVGLVTAAPAESRCQTKVTIAQREHRLALHAVISAAPGREQIAARATRSTASQLDPVSSQPQHRRSPRCRKAPKPDRAELRYSGSGRHR